jgi:hypothetical protein
MEAAMYPKWIVEAARLACADCRYCTSVHNIVAIGMSRPSKQEAYIGPLAMLILICPGCGRRIEITLREPIETVILAMRELVRLADETGRNTPPPINLGKRTGYQQCYGHADPQWIRSAPPELPGEPAGHSADAGGDSGISTSVAENLVQTR